MKLSDLRRMKQYRRFVDFTESNLITGVGLYEPLLINVGNITTTFTETPDHQKLEFRDEVSADVKAFISFLKSKDTIDLPCPCCKRNQPHSCVGWFNPRIANERENDTKEARATGRVPISNMRIGPDEEEKGFKTKPLIERTNYRFGEDLFFVSPWNAFDDNTRSQYSEADEEEFRHRLALKCIHRLLLVASEIRKDYKCAMDSTHRCFIGFTLELAIHGMPEELAEYERKLSIDANAKMTAEEYEAAELFQELQFSLIARKVSQYPSMADMQLFVTERYRKVLGRRYGDYRRALGLNSSEIGAGALVYLRRVFESIVEDVHKECTKDSSWNEDEYKDLKFNDKVKFLEERGYEIIPAELQPVRNKLYGAISIGVHELEEEECKAIFPDLKDAIDLFLEAKIAKNEKEKKVKEINQRIQAMKS